MLSGHLREISDWLIIGGAAGAFVSGAALAVHPRFRRPRGRHHASSLPPPWECPRCGLPHRIATCSQWQPGEADQDPHAPAPEPGEWVPELSGPLARWTAKLRSSEFRLISHWRT